MKVEIFVFLVSAFLLLTPWSRVHLEKLRGFQLVNKFSAFYGTRRFISGFTSARPLSLSWARSIQSTRPNHTSWKYILILSSHLRLLSTGKCNFDFIFEGDLKNRLAQISFLFIEARRLFAIKHSINKNMSSFKNQIDYTDLLVLP